MHRRGLIVVVGVCVLCGFGAFAQAPDFLHPQQKGAFPLNGLGYAEFSLNGPQSGFVDPVNLGSGNVVVTLDQAVSELKATGTNLVKLGLITGQVKKYTDNAYDPDYPFPFEGKPADITAFARKLAAQGFACFATPLSLVANIIEGATPVTSRVEPTDPRAFMIQHVARLVSLAQLAEQMGCEYFQVFGDDTEQLVANPALTDLWIQGITQIRAVFSGRLLAESSWGYGFYFPPEIIRAVDIFGAGILLASTNHADPSVPELVAAYQKNADGIEVLKAYGSLHAYYGKPVLIADAEFESYKGSNYLGDTPLFGLNPASQFTLDYQEQVNGYTAFFQAVPTLDPAWMLGVTFNSFDRVPYSWKDKFMPPYLTSLGESLRGKPALQTITQAYQAPQPLKTPASGWWYSPSAPGRLFAVEAENGVVHFGNLGFSSKGDPQWSVARCAQIALGTFAGTAEQYTGGQALNRPATPSTGVVDGPAVKLIFDSAATATLQIGDQSIRIQRYQFSDQWASPMLNAPRTGWWDLPAQSGRGYFLEVQGSTLLAGGLIYTSAGQPGWFTSTGPVDAAGVFSGALTICSASPNTDGTLQTPVCKPTSDAIRISFNAPWRATLTLASESAVEIRRYRLNEIGWAGPAPAFPLPTPTLLGESATVNAASLAVGVAPGSIGTIFGAGLTRGVNGVVSAPGGALPYSLRGTSVLVNGIPAPIFAVANVNGLEQINFQVPWEVRGEPNPPQVNLTPIVVSKKPAVTIVVVNNGVLSAPMHAVITDIQPAIITSDGSRVVAVHSDYSLVTPQNPARPGDVITLYGVGFGPVTPLPPTGAPAGASPPSVMSPTPVVSIGASYATVSFAGLSPGSVSLYQFNIVVPDKIGIGDLPVLIRTGSETSNIVVLPVQGIAGAAGELIRNGSFENPLGQEWLTYVDSSSPASATFERTTSTAHDGNYSEHVTVTASARNLAHVQLDQRNISFTQDVTYILQFWARSSNTRTLRVGVLGGNDNHSFGLGTSFPLGPDWQRFAVSFRAAETGIAHLDMFLGEQTGEVWFDSVSLIAVAP